MYKRLYVKYKLFFSDSNLTQIL